MNESVAVLSLPHFHAFAFWLFFAFIKKAKKGKGNGKDRK
jgi:hypothetical protein